MIVAYSAALIKCCLFKICTAINKEEGGRGTGKADALASADAGRMQQPAADPNGITQSPTVRSIMDQAANVCRGVRLLCPYSPVMPPDMTGIFCGVLCRYLNHSPCMKRSSRVFAARSPYIASNRSFTGSRFCSLVPVRMFRAMAGSMRP